MVTIASWVIFLATKTDQESVNRVISFIPRQIAWDAKRLVSYVGKMKVKLKL